MHVTVTAWALTEIPEKTFTNHPSDEAVLPMVTIHFSLIVFHPELILFQANSNEIPSKRSDKRVCSPFARKDIKHFRIPNEDSRFTSGVRILYRVRILDRVRILYTRGLFF
jgi:hypothetical protein